ncbi:MAG: DUF4852 domain-containing protein [Alphaproteobacteria bacterium]|nr:DUF4852 domain-containing protein [Alphaproteobacteria bacterium]
MSMIARLILLGLCMLFAFSARAEEEYIKPNPTSLLQTLIRFDALDINDDYLLDNYAMIAECDLYKSFYGNDFKWNNEVRVALRNSIRKEKNNYPILYLAHTQLQLDRYDFNENLFRFTPETAIRSINLLLLYELQKPVCGKTAAQYIPLNYKAVLDEPVFVPGLPFEQKDAEMLLKLMKEDNNTARNIYTRFYIRIFKVKPLNVSVEGVEPRLSRRYAQAGTPGPRNIHLLAHLQTIEFFEDPAMTKLVYTYKYKP